MTLYVNKNNQQLGPFTLAQAQRMVATGVLQPSDSAWHEGLPEWLPLQEIPGFSERFVPPVPVDQHDRPILVWILSLLYFFSFPISLVSLVVLPLFSSGAIQFKDKQQLSVFHPTTPVEYAIAWLNLLLTIVWAVQFFRLKRIAFPLYIVSLLVSIAVTLYSIIFEDWLSAIGQGGSTVIVGVIIGWAVNFALLGYNWHLARKGVLN